MTTEPRPAAPNGTRPVDTGPTDAPSVVVDSHPQSRIENSQPEGIGRVVALRDLCAWNNLGRNVVVASDTFQPRAVFDQTQFPDDDELSQYDLDIHAILELRDAAVLVVLNHLGLLRAFRTADLEHSGRVECLEPVWTSVFVDDVERVVAVDGRLVGSRPRREHAGGLLVSQALIGTPGPHIDLSAELENWGMVTALEALTAAGQDWIALGGDGRVSLMPIEGGTPGSPHWDVRIGFQAATCTWDGTLLWVSGSDAAGGVDDYDWEALHGGEFVGIDLDDGKSVIEGRFTQDLAWGNGGTAVVTTGGLVCGIGRTGALHLHSANDGRPLASSAPLAPQPLGIAHAAVVGDHVLFGFNRAGYQLQAVAASTLSELAGQRS